MHRNEEDEIDLDALRARLQKADAEIDRGEGLELVARSTVADRPFDALWRGRAVLSLLVAEHAIDAGLIDPMAIHAAVHGDVCLSEQPFPFGDLPVAGLTLHA
jgi:hypothetical protein